MCLAHSSARSSYEHPFSAIQLDYGMVALPKNGLFILHLDGCYCLSFCMCQSWASVSVFDSYTILAIVQNFHFSLRHDPSLAHKQTERRRMATKNDRRKKNRTILFTRQTSQARAWHGEANKIQHTI